MDLIERQAAIEAADSWDGGYNKLREGMIREALNALPSAQPERKKGKWIQKSKPMEFCTEWWYECSECGEKPPRDRYGNPDFLSNYCPNCGAEMKGEDDG